MSVCLTCHLNSIRSAMCVHSCASLITERANLPNPCYLLDMHRGFFARAISDHPQDPLGSPYGSSFIAAYRSAGSLVALVRNIHSQLKELTERMWFLWTHLFSCSVSLLPLARLFEAQGEELTSPVFHSRSYWVRL